MMALTIGTLAPLHRSPLQQSTSHLVIFTEGFLFLQFWMQTDELALTIGASAPLHRSPLQQSSSHLVIFTEGLSCVQFFALHADDLAHPLAKSSEFGSPEMISPFTSCLAQRSQPSGQITGILLSWQSSQLLTEKHW